MSWVDGVRARLALMRSSRTADARFRDEIDFHVGETGLTPQQVALLVAHAVLMIGVCLLACVVPTRRALQVQLTEALRTD